MSSESVTASPIVHKGFTFPRLTLDDMSAVEAVYRSRRRQRLNLMIGDIKKLEPIDALAALRQADEGEVLFGDLLHFLRSAEGVKTVLAESLKKVNRQDDLPRVIAAFPLQLELIQLAKVIAGFDTEESLLPIAVPPEGTKANPTEAAE